ncbi:3',5'-cyclic adenosine monophosphate phosphodiesterase CpdA [Microbulbifer aggregans]|uniref:3',5'-cyclic adenosine monophosphate phosphodiesterase CpdA n=1 Tax=Microbulbifer aggregans TaxID=1769779 RepID=A0A1C9W462_9GAMM|nr:3',5'-cyclic-AMP phosphodiesterase [Microbulbifer aggregans]AOS95904.1 3',5'-cyclic adenosine monophosphate phosphodiesterase CpdA [Microbulbifer aggregans]
MSEESKGRVHRLVQFTDPHIGGRPNYQLLGLDTGRTLDEVLARIARDQGNADLLVATGDITANGSEAAYGRFLKRMQSVHKPWYWLPGNHDSVQRMMQLAPGRFVEELALGHWRLLLLDTSVENQICGGLSETQLHRLEASLQREPERPVLILMHHQPVPVGSDWIDGHMLREGHERFLTVVSAAPQVRALLWGHVHQQFDSHLGHIGLHATPSTSVQFTPGSGPFSVDEEMPGYRWLDLFEDGTYETGVERVLVSEYSVDLTSGGY